MAPTEIPKEKARRQIRQSVVLCGCVVIAAPMYGFDPREFRPESIVFLAWVLSPYIFLTLIAFAMRRVSTRKTSIVFDLLTYSMLGFSIYAYFSILNDSSSTAGLLFLFLPIWLNLFGAILLAAGLLWAFLSKPGGASVGKRKRRTTPDWM